jgi:hypothetical protein
MPLLKNRGDHVKVYRPRGAKYGEARDAVAANAIAKAQTNFSNEFGYVPKQHLVVIEVVGVTGGWLAHYIEILD